MKQYFLLILRVTHVLFKDVLIQKYEEEKYYKYKDYLGGLLWHPDWLRQRAQCMPLEPAVLSSLPAVEASPHRDGVSSVGTYISTVVQIFRRGDSKIAWMSTISQFL